MTFNRPMKAAKKRAPRTITQAPASVIAPKCLDCGRRRRAEGPCWFCGDETQTESKTAPG